MLNHWDRGRERSEAISNTIRLGLRKQSPTRRQAGATLGNWYPQRERQLRYNTVTDSTCLLTLLVLAAAVAASAARMTMPAASLRWECLPDVVEGCLPRLPSGPSFHTHVARKRWQRQHKTVEHVLLPKAFMRSMCALMLDPSPLTAEEC